MKRCQQSHCVDGWVVEYKACGCCADRVPCQECVDLGEQAEAAKEQAEREEQDRKDPGYHRGF